MTDQPTAPKTFADLDQGHNTETLRCSLCGAAAICRTQIVVRPIKTTGQGSAGNRNAVASQTRPMCEEHAVAIFAATRRAMR